MKKKFLALFLGICILFSCASTAFASETEAELYKIYDDDMLFEQEKDAVFAGKAPAGSTVSAELFGADGRSVASGEAVTDESGIFSVSFVAPKGGFEEYTVILKCNGNEFDSLERVVFGELWLAGGQSNMMFPLAGALTAREDFAAGVKQSKWIRAMLSEAYAPDNINHVDPREDITDANWVTGEEQLIYSVSAVAFFFAEELLEELDMPIGILNISLGGTSIGSWLSREAIEGDEAVKNDFLSDTNMSPYIPKESWVPTEIDCYNAMTVNYNLRIHAVRHFRPSGIIWYQGETDLIYDWSIERYTRAFNLLQKSYTQLFEYEDGLLPVIYTQLAPYIYSDGGWKLPAWNFGYTLMQKAQPDSRAMITLHDLPVTYTPDVGVIHPEHKEEVGDRMAACAASMLYSAGAAHTAASLKSAEIRDSSIYATLENTDEGIAAEGELRCFSICGEDGVYVQAQAEIVSADTVRIWADSVESPVSAAYGFCVNNHSANLFALRNGEKILPVAPFVTDPAYNTQYWLERPWAECESDTVWRNNGEKNSGFYSSWTAENADIAFNSANAYSGNGGMNIKASGRTFSVSPLRIYEDGFAAVNFLDEERCLSNYGTVSFYVRNNGTADITFDGLKLYENKALWYSPADTAAGQPESVIPADGEWHLVTLNLDKLCLWGNECGILFANDKLGFVRNIVFCFSGENADISLDHIRFTPATNEEVNRFDINIANADNILEFISGFFVTIIGAFAKLFNA